MKKIIKVIAGFALSGAMMAGIATAAGCASDKWYYGEYSYPNAWSPTAPYYGIKVRVEVQSDSKGDRIRKVEIIDSGYTEVSDGWAQKDLWLNGVDGLLLQYRGKYIADVLAQTVRVNNTSAPGQPEGVSDSDLAISGATQGSGRLLLAVQAALSDAAGELGYTVGEGEYSYPNAWDASAPYYGVRVRVVTKDDVVQAVALADSDYVEVSDGWKDKTIWLNGVENLLASYKGKKVEDIMAVKVGVNSTSAPGQPESVSDSDLVITGATQGSGRVLLAVQDALKEMYGIFEELEGEYHYPNAWNPTGPQYGIKVKVVVNKGKIVSVSVADSDYVEVSDGWAQKDLWLNGVDGLLAKYKGKEIADVLAQTVTVNNSTAPGQPEAVTDESLVISGATQGSGRLLLAVQDALKNTGYTVTEGEYKYENTWTPGTFYGIKVKVVTKGDDIEKVAVVPSEYTSVTPTWQDKQKWIDGLDGLLAKYSGKSAADVLMQTVTVNTESTPGQPESVSDSEYVITGATQGSGRLLLAVQNALENCGFSVSEGEYHYPNAWNPTGPQYGIKVKVVVNKDNKIVKVAVVDSDYVEVSDGWADKQKWLDGVDSLVAKYSGKSVSDILAATVTVNNSTAPGQPEAVSDSGLVISGATQGSGRLLLAVQNALQK